MIFHAPILALLLASLISVATILWAAVFALRLLRHWQPASGHAQQIDMEKRTYLVSTALGFVLALELASLILFVANADQMAVMFVGAMCAVGTLNVNDYGMPALLLKLAVFFGALVWLVINQIDNKAPDYPFTRLKYALLIGLAPLVVAAAGAQLAYFLNLETDTITSCCSLAFIPEGGGVAGELSSLPPGPALVLLFGGLAGMVVLALGAMRLAPLRALYGLASVGFFVVAITAIVSVISSYIYEQPHHHCPFDVLKAQFAYIGYWMYLPLFSATGIGMAVGVLALRRTPASLAGKFDRLMQRRIALSIALYALFGLVALIAILKSNLILIG